MEPPWSWDILTASLSVSDLNHPNKVWAFLVLQGLVRDEASNRETFCQIVEEELEHDREQGPVTGASLSKRLALAMERAGLTLPASDASDPNAELASERWQIIQEWQDRTAELPPSDPISSTHQFCIYCGFHYTIAPKNNHCPSCEGVIPEPSATRGKPCSRCQEPNLMFASFCECCGSRLVVVHCYQCGSEVQPQAVFCPTCGLKISAPGSQGEVVPIHSRKTEASLDESTLSLPRQRETERVAEKVTETVGKKAKTNLIETRLWRLYDPSPSPEALAQKSSDLFSTLSTVIQELETVKDLLKEKGVWDEAEYKRLRIARMLHDHNSAGATPWRGYSIFPYTLEETEFLRQTFQAAEEEIKKFEDEVESLSTLT